MKKLIIVLGLMLFSFASAADWFEIMDKLYLDLDTIEFNQRKKQIIKQGNLKKGCLVCC